MIGIALSSIIAMGCGGVCGLENPQTRQALGISQEVGQQLDEMFYKHHLKMIDLRANLEKKELMLDQLMGQDQLDEAKIKKAAKDVIKAQNAIQEERIDFQIKVLKLLTPEQRAKLMHMGKGHGGKDMPMMMPGMDGPPGM